MLGDGTRDGMERNETKRGAERNGTKRKALKSRCGLCIIIASWSIEFFNYIAKTLASL
jgi:hypothetical protein